MTGDIIKQFLVSLGFQVDKKSMDDFNKGIASATKRVVGLYASIKLMSAAVFYGFTKISDGLEQMGYEMRLIAPTINKVLVLRRELLLAYSRAGVDIYKAVQQSVKFNMSLQKTRFALKALVEGVAVRFFPMLTKQMDLFRKRIYDNMPRIQDRLEKFIKVLFAAFKATWILGERVWSILERVFGFFQKLHRATDGWSTIIMGVVAAWRLLNLAFVATPLGMILTGLLAILALYDDFQTFKEGGESLFDWSKAVPYIDAAAKAMTQLAQSTIEFFSVLKALGSLLMNVATLDFSAALNSLKELVSRLGSLLSSEGFEKALMLAKLTSPATWAKAVLTDNFGGVSVAGMWAKAFGNGDGSLGPTGMAPALGADGGSTVNQRVSQQTSITVQGSANAEAVGKSVAGEQQRVNFDMFRNMKGATR